MNKRIRFFRRPESTAGAFTLVELLAAMAIFILLLGVLFAIVSQVTSVWQKAQMRIEPRVNARTVLDRMTRELSMAALPDDRAMRYASAAAAPESAGLGLQLLVNPPGLPAAYLNPQAIFWQAPVPVGNSGMEMAEIGYFVRWDERKANNPRAMLCRMFAHPGDAEYRIFSQPTDWVNAPILDSLAPGIENDDPARSDRGWFADNVIGLWIRALDPQGNPIAKNALDTAYPASAFDSRKGYSYTVNSVKIIKSGAPLSGGVYQLLATLPPTIEIAVVILDSRSANRLTAKPAYAVTTPPTPTSFWTDINQFVAALPEAVRRGATVHSTRVNLRNAD